uniref:G-protein coupled receptors family 2 profile 2 domain-containing protein n=1 Tax=Graphocephala atropunctata TaxID=36148 RepID=A0A1B6M8D2_9HEMI
MCFDIWWVFSGLMPLRGSIKEAEHKKFLIYSGYAWGGPLLMSLATATMEFHPSVPAGYIKPQFGIDRCWFKGAEAQVMYFYLPIGVLVFANLMMFSTTSCRLKAHTNNSKMLQSEDSRRHQENEKQRFNLYLKLFVVMGVTWVMELVSFVVGGSQLIWLLSDTCNTLQGLLIFVIFVCKPRILQLIRQRFSPRRHGDSVYNNSRTSMSRLSRSNSSKSSQQYSVHPDVIGSDSKATIVSDIDKMDLLTSKV